MKAFVGRWRQEGGNLELSQRPNAQQLPTLRLHSDPPRTQCPEATVVSTFLLADSQARLNCCSGLLAVVIRGSIGQ